MVQTKDPSGEKSKTYIFDGIRIEVLPYFIYEVNLYKYWKGGFCMLGTRTFKSDRFLNIKCKRKIKRYDTYFIEKEVTLIGAPYQFIRENNLPEYKSVINTKKLKRK